MIEINMTGTRSYTVTENDTAQVLGSGTLPVLATPRLVTWLEETSWRLIADELSAGQSTVGGSMNLQHLAPTAVGREVTCYAKVVAQKGAKVVFSVWAMEGEQRIAEGEHVRFVVTDEKFLDKIG